MIEGSRDTEESIQNSLSFPVWVELQVATGSEIERFSI
jgi:hypothetical protein